MLAEMEAQLEASKDKVLDKEGQLAKARDLFGKVQQDHKELKSGLDRLTYISLKSRLLYTSELSFIYLRAVFYTPLLYTYVSLKSFFFFKSIYMSLNRH